jgi:hypothetical protein
LKEIAVASGAPINPRAMGSGPHTIAEVSDERLTSKGDALDTKKVVKNRVNRRDHENDLGRDREETLGLEISTVKTETVRAFPELGHRAYIPRYGIEGVCREANGRILEIYSSKVSDVRLLVQKK